jgi:hypothetical protein
MSEQRLVVELVDVARTYPGGLGVRALDGVTVGFAAGTFSAVIRQVDLAALRRRAGSS